jgi:hypothetical protein
VLAADVDGDGKPDMVSGNWSSGALTLSLGKGDGTFAPGQVLIPAGRPALGDLDRDGLTDVVVSRFPSYVDVWLGLGGGRFLGRQIVDAGVGAQSSWLFAADLDGDAGPDLVAVNRAKGQIEVMLNDGRANLSPAVSYSVGQAPVLAIPADVDGDGRPDVVVANNASNDLTVLRNVGGGQLQAYPATVPAGIGPRSLASGDFNRDGKTDLIVASTGYPDGGATVATVLLGNADGTFMPMGTFNPGASTVSVATGDIDNDGILDFALLSLDGVSAYRGNGNGTFTYQVGFSTSSYPAQIVIGDLDGDGLGDLVIVGMQNNAVAVEVYTSGGATFAWNRQYYAAQDTPSSVALADINADGSLDIVVANEGSSNVTVLQNSGFGQFGAQLIYPVGLNPVSLTVADFDRDGRPDVMVADSALSYLRNIGNICRR